MLFSVYKNIQEIKREPEMTPLAKPLVTPVSTPIKQDVSSKASRTGPVRALLQTPQNMATVESRTCQTTSSSMLTSDQEKAYVDELEILVELCQFDFSTVDYSDLDQVVSSLTFDNLLCEVEKRCPLVYDILRVFVRAEEDRKIKTAAEKLLRVVHLFGCMLRIGRERSSSLPRLFGILLTSYGCGQGKHQFMARRCITHMYFYIVLTIVMGHQK